MEVKKLLNIREQLSHLEKQSLTPVRRAFVRVVEFFYLWRKELAQDKCTQRAASLTYTTILAIFPLVAIIALFIPVFFGGAETMQSEIYQKIEDFLIPSAGANVEESMSKYFEAFRENSTYVGFFGIIGLMLAAVALFTTMEKSFNTIWRTRVRRSWLHVFSHFTTLIILIPVFIGGSIVLTAELSRRVEFVGTTFSLTIPYLMTCLGLAFAYYILPNTRVKLLYALIGGIVAGLAWEVAKVLFGYYVGTARLSLFIKSVGAIPIFLVWLYFSWLIVLVGAELSYLLQNYRRLSTETFLRPSYTILDSKLLFLIFLVIAGRFQRGEGSTSFSVIKNKVPINVDEIEEAVNILSKGGLITETANNDFAISKPLEMVNPSDVLALGSNPLSFFNASDNVDSLIVRHLKDLHHSISEWGSYKNVHDLFTAETIETTIEKPLQTNLKKKGHQYGNTREL